MPPTPAELAARRASMAQTIAQQARTAQVIGTGGVPEEGPWVTRARRADEGGFDIFDPRQGREALAYRKEGKVAMVTPDKKYVWIPEAEAQSYADQGYQVETLTEHHARKEQETIEASTSDAALGGGVSGVTGGLSDVLLEEYYGKAAARREGRVRAASPVASGVAELVGFGVGLVAAAPEAVAGAASKAGRQFAGAAARVRMPHARARQLQKAMLSDPAGELANVGKVKLAPLKGKPRLPGVAERVKVSPGPAPHRPGAVDPLSLRTPRGAAGGAARAEFARTWKPGVARAPGGGRVGKLKGEPRLGSRRVTVAGEGPAAGPTARPRAAPPVDEPYTGHQLLDRTLQPRATVGGRDVGSRRVIQGQLDQLGEIAGAPLTSTSEALQGRLARTMTRGAVEGGLYAGGREASAQALSGDDYNVAHIVEQAIQGAAWGGAVSMAGAGLGSVVSRVSRNLSAAVRGPLAKRAELPKGRFDVLLDRQAGLVDRLKFTTHPVQRANLRSALKDVRQVILADRIKMFAVAARGLNKLRMPIALGAAPLTYGFTMSNLMLGMVASAVPHILKTRLAMRAMTGIGRGAAWSAGKAAPFTGKLTSLAIVGGLTSNDAEQLAASLEATDAEEVGLAALQGYQLAGMDPGMASYMADFQKRRVELLQQVIMRRPDSTSGVVAARILNAVEDPRRIATRLAEGDVLTEDLLALQYLFPDVYEELQKQSKLLLERPGLSARQRVDLMKLAGTHGKLTQGLQQAIKPVPQKAPQQSKPKAFNPAQDTATESQRLQGGQQ